MLNNEQDDEECDATNADSSNSVGNIKKSPTFQGRAFLK